VSLRRYGVNPATCLSLIPGHMLDLLLDVVVVVAAAAADDDDDDGE